MTREEAIRTEVLELIKRFPTVIIDGRETVVINGKNFPKDWFIEHCVRMRKDGEI